MAKDQGTRVSIEGKDLVIRIRMQAPTASASGKTLVIATTHGNQATDAKVDGQPVILGVNAYIRKS
jgi:hypothetical protein